MVIVASIYKDPYFLWYLANLLELYSTLYGKFILPGDFIIEAENKVKKDFLQEHKEVHAQIY